MEESIEQIKDELYNLSLKYSALTPEDSSNSMEKLLQFIVNTGMATVPKNIYTVAVKDLKNGLYRGTFNNLECSFLLFTKRVQAERALVHFKTFPDLFVRPISVVEHEGKVYLSVELFEKIEPNQEPSDQRNEMLKKILRLAIKLDVHHQLNDGFEQLVISNGDPKLCKTSDRSVDVTKQAGHLVAIMSKIVKSECNDHSHRRDFLRELVKSYTMTQLHHCVYHPLLMTSHERLLFCPSSMLVIHATSTYIDHKANLGARDSTWQPKVRESGMQGLIKALSFRFYADTIFEWFQFVRNCYNHFNEELVEVQNGVFRLPYENLFELAKDLDKLFPDLQQAMHNYMCSHCLYDEFKGQEARYSIMLTIHSKMKFHTCELQNMSSADFMEMMDIYDFVLAKLSAQCKNPSSMASVRNGLMDDRKKVFPFVGDTMSDVREKVKTKKDAKIALNRLVRHLRFFTNCLKKLLSRVNSFQYLVSCAIFDCCDMSTAADQSKKATNCGLPDIKVVNDVLRVKLLTKTEQKSIVTSCDMLDIQVKEWFSS